MLFHFVFLTAVSLLAADKPWPVFAFQNGVHFGKVEQRIAVLKELGYDGILINTAVARAGDPVAMARAFALAIEAGRLAFRAEVMDSQELATASTPQFGTPFSPWSDHG